MRAHHFFLLLVWVVAGCRKPDTASGPTVPDAGVAGRLISVGPRLLSNQTSQPLSVVGEGLHDGLLLQLGAPLARSLPLTVLDGRHAFARLPGGLSLGGLAEVVVEATIPGLAGQAPLRLIEDTSFPDLVALALSGDGRFAFALSQTTDTVFRVELGTGVVTPITTDDGPSALATWTDAQHREWLVVSHLYSPTLLLVGTLDVSARRTLPSPAMAAGVVVEGDVAFVAEQARDSVAAVDLVAGVERWRTPVAPNPRALVPAPSTAGLIVGSLATGALELLEARTGAVLASVEPGPGTSIVGGGTAKYAAQVMNGKAPRALAWSKKLAVAFVTSIGPNIGPNGDQMEVSMNGGVGVVDPRKGWLRHLGFGAGVTEALALDDARGLLYASDVGLGLVRVLDAKKLAGSDATARQALLQELALRPPPGFPSIRPASDFNVQGRAGPSLHAGPRALALSADGKTLYVLERFTGTLAVLDVSRAGKAEWKAQLPVTNVLAQRGRRLGQVLYHADLGRTAMTCDACHVDGHGEGVLFEKTMPLRIYRSTTVRGSRETPPYFTPASTHSMGETSKIVGGRNRFHNPDPTPEEIDALTLYISLLPTLPNPFVGADGAPLEALTLPDGRVGHPRAGLALFEGKAGCAACHPAPQFTLDQDPQTRARYLDVGTPQVMPLRQAWQNTRFEGFATPSLVGSWDVFPMLTTGLAGLEVRADGAVRVNSRFPLRAAVEQWAPKHGRADLLSVEERDDLLAYVMSL